MSRPVIVIGHASTDPHVMAVVEAIEGRAEILLFDVSALEQASFELSDGKLMFDGVTLTNDSRPRGWLRRLAPPTWRQGVELGSKQWGERCAWLTLLQGIIESMDVDWVTTLPDVMSSENKVVQLSIARNMGIAVPRTTIASDVSLVSAELGDEVIVKPLGPGGFASEDGVGHVVWATPIRRDDERLRWLGGAPFLVQERIDTVEHLRVVTVGEKVWTCSLPALDLPADWRQSDKAHTRFVLGSGHEALEAQALALAKQLRCGYTSQDWIVGRGGRSVFLDLNPAGQWLFLPEQISGSISEAIANWLAAE